MLFGLGPSDLQEEIGLPTIAPVLFDLNGRAFVVDTDGKAVACSGVDQRVVIILGTPKGQIASAPDLGVDIEKMMRAPKIRLPGVVDTELRSALGDLIRANQIRINSITTDNRAGTVYFLVDYSNLTLPGAPRRIAKAPV